ncbi:unnamed protein product [Bursaphelenchus xylophilus]|uniref:(pine wood nematode) hypothetical protein n=1 Tax=Bursaphelenchus xylophilus TaxID=6326 RepID=A0A1I7RJN5_BURXY|nr:unnamed protein product [Bursaphelenchus xylophilus]CAG9128966.1 unnamed protein product [Bursaphelenchus xylophilus]
MTNNSFFQLPNVKTDIFYSKSHVIHKYDVEVRKIISVRKGVAFFQELSEQSLKSSRSERIILCSSLVRRIMDANYPEVDMVYDGKKLMYTSSPIECMDFDAPQHKIGDFDDTNDYIVSVNRHSAMELGQMSPNDVTIFLELLTSNPLMYEFQMHPLQKQWLFVRNGDGYENFDQTSIFLRRGIKKVVNLQPADHKSAGFASIVVIDIKLEGFYSLLNFEYLNSILIKRSRVDVDINETERNLRGVIFGFELDKRQRIVFERLSDVGIGQIFFPDSEFKVIDYLENKYKVRINPDLFAMMTPEGNVYPQEFVYPIPGQFINKSMRETCDEMFNYKVNNPDEIYNEIIKYHSVYPEYAEYFEKFGVRLMNNICMPNYEEDWELDSGYLSDEMEKRSRFSSGRESAFYD